VPALDVHPYLERWARVFGDDYVFTADKKVIRKRPGNGAFHIPISAGSLLGKLMAGRGSSVCPTCKGSRRMPGHLVGSMQDFINVPCPGCGGEGRVDGDLASTQRTRTIACPYCWQQLHGRWRSTGEINGRTCHKCRGGKRQIVDLKVHPATIKGTRYMGPDAAVDKTTLAINSLVLGWAQANDTYWLARVVVEEYCRNGTQQMKSVKMGVSRCWFKKNLSEAHRRLSDEIKKFI